jgi:lipopolysaccharide export system protein LptA
MRTTMTRSGKTSLAAALVLAFSLTLPGAGVSQDPGSGPGMFGSNTFAYTPDGFALIGDAEIMQGDNRLRAGRIEAFTNADSAVTRVEATGEVFFVTPTQTLRGDRAVYDLDAGEIVMTGNVIVTQGRNVMTGSRLVYNVRTESARMDGAPTPAGNRVQGVFYPNGTTPPDQAD